MESWHLSLAEAGLKIVRSSRILLMKNILLDIYRTSLYIIAGT